MQSKLGLLPDNVNEKQKFYGVFLKNNMNLYSSIIDLPRNTLKRKKSRSDKINSELISSTRPTLSYLNKKVPFYQRIQINHDSTWKSIFDFVVLILVNVSSLCILYDFSFQDEKKFSSTVAYTVIEVLFCVYILLQFLQKYQDPETLLIVSSYKKIAMNYIKGWFILDFVSVLPIENSTFYIKLIRLIRLPKLVQTFDMKRFDNLASSFYSKSDKSENGNRGLLLIFNIRYIFKIIRLIFMAFILTYFVGCIWFIFCTQVNNYLPSYDKEPINTFIRTYLDDEAMTESQKLLICCYFVLTTLTTVGFGDYVPQNNYEKIFAIVIMLLGVAVFSYVMSSFTDQITIYNQTFGGVDKGSLLQNWLHLLNQYSRNQPFKIKLINSIDSHFKFFWRNDRTSSINKENPYLTNLSKEIKMKIIDYLWLDVFVKFPSFFFYKDYRQKYYKFYYDLSFLFLPRQFQPDELIYLVNSEVEEMYFIIEGIVTIGYSYDIGETKVHAKIYSGDFFGGYYTLYNTKSVYHYMAMNECKMYGLNKFDLLKLLKQYPEIQTRMRAVCYKKFRDHIKKLVDRGIYDETHRRGLEEFKPVPMEEENANWNGMTINKVIQNKIQEKERELQELNQRLEQKYQEVEKERAAINEEFSETSQSLKSKMNLFGRKSSKILEYGE